MRNVNSNNSGAIAWTADLASFDAMNEPLIPAQITNLVTSWIPSASYSALSTSAERIVKEHSKNVDDLPSLTGILIKDDTANHDSSMLCHAKESVADALMKLKKRMLLRAVSSWPPNRKEIACMSSE